jgi:hypothetical protein
VRQPLALPGPRALAAECNVAPLSAVDTAAMIGNEVGIAQWALMKREGLQGLVAARDVLRVGWAPADPASA